MQHPSCCGGGSDVGVYGCREMLMMMYETMMMMTVVLRFGGIGEVVHLWGGEKSCEVGWRVGYLRQRTTKKATYKRLKGSFDTLKEPNKMGLSAYSWKIPVYLYKAYAEMPDHRCVRIFGHSYIEKETQFLGDKHVSWSSKNQKFMAISSTEAEYIALSGCYAQILWMRSQLTD
ncbi:hypothetical protein Tco_0926222 [Tanacetum coccineum]|uniref:Retrovirus-related Pol polyprotein from transposon TNT 1-94 n=1 Tax=Tanacetum coccineum TaxID=301880 RepID=A0ABQ5DBZ0_9ASTR